MQYKIIHEIPGRMRVKLTGMLPDTEAAKLKSLLLEQPYVLKCTIYKKTGSLAISHKTEDRNSVLHFLATLTRSEIQNHKIENSLSLAPSTHDLIMQLANMLVWRTFNRAFLPMRVRTILTLARALPYWHAAYKSLRAHKLDVPVLDAAAISMGFLQADTSTSGNTIFMLRVGDVLQDFTQRESSSSLIESLLEIPSCARRIDADAKTEAEVPIDALCLGDVVVCRASDCVPIDGEVIKGDALINQASLTGEAQAVRRAEGDSVFAGTSVEQGEIYVMVTSDAHASKMRSIAAMAAEDSANKSEAQRRIESAADKLVPWNFLLAGIIALTTKNLQKTSAALMVDYSCVLKLSGAIAVMSAQKESAKRGFTVRGSKDFENMAAADTIVFDKTGTLTQATPHVCCVEAYDGYTESEVLRLAACLEEHFPHPVARAVVNAAATAGIEHRERHAEVEYIVAHGIASSLDGKRCVIGSEHFVCEDENVRLNPTVREHILNKANGASPLYLAVDGVLRGVIFIEDPLKENAAAVVKKLRSCGFKRIIMLTGDNERTAARIARQVGITEYQSDMLPEDKRAFVCRLQEAGHKVCMIGDGVNDCPALTAASVSISMATGSAVAKEAASISLVSEDLNLIVDLRRLSRELHRRMRRGYVFAVAYNTALLALGVTSKITPEMSALLHNTGTVALSALNTRAYL